MRVFCSEPCRHRACVTSSHSYPGSGGLYSVKLIGLDIVNEESQVAQALLRVEELQVLKAHGFVAKRKRLAVVPMLQSKDNSMGLSCDFSQPRRVGDASALSLTADVKVSWSIGKIIVLKSVVSLPEGSLAVVIEVVDGLIDPILLHCSQISRQSIWVVVLPRRAKRNQAGKDKKGGQVNCLHRQIYYIQQSSNRPTKHTNIPSKQHHFYTSSAIVVIKLSCGSKMNVIKHLKDHINWFPGHMQKTLRLIEQNAHKVDVFMQIRDARIPYCSRNPEFDLIIKKNQKEKLIVFNKYDLCDQRKTDKIIKDYNDYGIRCFAVSSQKHDDMRGILGYLKENYKHKYKQVGLWMMACGTPNVGKSSIINQIRSISDLDNKRAAAKATASVCTTRGLSGFKILSNPLMFLLDTPGVMIPSAIPKELGMKMAVLGLIKEQTVQKETIVSYIIEQCEADGNDKYWKNLRIDKPNNATEYLDSIRSKHKLYDYDAAYDRIIISFRQGKLGRVTLDDPITVT